MNYSHHEDLPQCVRGVWLISATAIKRIQSRLHHVWLLAHMCSFSLHWMLFNGKVMVTMFYSSHFGTLAATILVVSARLLQFTHRCVPVQPLFVLIHDLLAFTLCLYINTHCNLHKYCCLYSVNESPWVKKPSSVDAEDAVIGSNFVSCTACILLVDIPWWSSWTPAENLHCGSLCWRKMLNAVCSTCSQHFG